MKFTEAEKPTVIGVIKETSAAAAAEALRRGTEDGASAFDLHISYLPENELSDPAKLSSIFTATSLPVLAVHYNYIPGGKSHVPDDERIRLMTNCLKYGAAGIDMQGYTFCAAPQASLQKYGSTETHPFIKKSPREVVLDPEAAEKQAETIRRVHSLGGEVLMSCHTGVFLNTDEIVPLAEMMEKRGADIIKIVTPCADEDELLVALHSAAELRKRIKAAVHYHCSGKYARITRYISPYFGSSLVFAYVSRQGRDPEQLDIKSFRAFWNEIKAGNI